MKIINKKTIITSISIGAIFASFNSYADSSQYHMETTKPQTEAKVDYSKITDVKEKKAIFIKNTLVGINNANEEICAEEKNIDDLKNNLNKNGKLTDKETKKMQDFATFYKVDTENQTSKDILNKLDVKIGTAPQSFVLAQAILESGWGTSRFARDYNNYYGLHCYKDGCGAKATGANVYMEIFKTPGDSTLGYYYRLNSGSAFAKFRDVRYKTKNDKNQLDPLLNTLGSYSELGLKEYKKRLMNVINSNNLTQYDKPACK